VSLPRTTCRNGSLGALSAWLELAALNTAPGSACAHVRAVLREWQADTQHDPQFPKTGPSL
jgi:hypothetical protein